MSSIRVLIAGDHSSFRQDLRQACELEGGLEVVGEAGNGREVVALAHELHPDVVLIDVDPSILDGVQATRLITAQSPSTRVIALATYPRDERVLRAIRAGANAACAKMLRRAR